MKVKLSVLRFLSEDLMFVLSAINFVFFVLVGMWPNLLISMVCFAIGAGNRLLIKYAYSLGDDDASR